MIAVDDLVIPDNNTRIHSHEQIIKLSNSIKLFGFTAPIIIDEQNIVLAGCGRVEAATLANIDNIPSVRVTGWSEKKAREYSIVDNYIFDMGETNHKAVEQIIKNINMDIYGDVLAELEHKMATLNDKQHSSNAKPDNCFCIHCGESFTYEASNHI